jgi:hypothetical protein
MTTEEGFKALEHHAEKSKSPCPAQSKTEPGELRVEPTGWIFTVWIPQATAVYDAADLIALCDAR